MKNVYNFVCLSVCLSVTEDGEVTTSGGGSGVASSNDQALDPAPSDDTTSSGEALDLAPTTGTASGGTEAEPYWPMTEPVSPYRAPTDQSPLTLEAIYAAMSTSVAGG